MALPPRARWLVLPRKTDDGVKYGWPTKPAVGEELAKTAERVRQALKA